jgi:hypothetical protein
VSMAVFSAHIFLFVCQLRRFLHIFFYLCVDGGVFCTYFFICVSMAVFFAQIFLFVCRWRRFLHRFFYLCVDGGVFWAGFVRCVALYKKNSRKWWLTAVFVWGNLGEPLCALALGGFTAIPLAKWAVNYFCEK